MHLDRRSFLHSSASVLALGLVHGMARAQDSLPPPPGLGNAPAKPPALAREQVQAIVGHAHGNLQKVRELVAQTPFLVNACWDQGGGDFEAPLEAAAHMGNRGIAEYLLSKGARPSLFAAGMLGQLEIVQAFLTLDPHAHLIPGPHGFTLFHCVKQGGPAAAPVLEWLRAQGVPAIAQRPLAYVWPAGTGPQAG